MSHPSFTTHHNLKYLPIGFDDIPAVNTTVSIGIALIDDNIADVVVFLDVGVEPVFYLILGSSDEFLADL
jgi:hypothetical protein